jgi:hypothetical protein
MLQLDSHVHTFMTYTMQIAYAGTVYEGPNFPSNDTVCATASKLGAKGIRQSSQQQTSDAGTKPMAFKV